MKKSDDEIIAELAASGFRWRVIFDGAYLPASVPLTLFHYTSMTTFRKMLESGRLWATEGHYLNDAAELRHAALLVRQCLRTSNLGESRSEQLLRAIEHAVGRDAEDRRQHVFLASFSECDDMLSQWRAYADDGAGVALGFDLNEVAAGSVEVQHLALPTLCRCDYDVAEQRRQVRTALQPVFDAATDIEDGPEGASLGVLRAAAFYALQVAHLLGCVFKNPGFAEEREWRAMTTLELIGKEHSLDAVRFRDRPRPPSPVPYVELPLSKEHGRLPLKKVVFGPKVDKLSQRAAMLVMKVHGYSPEIGYAAATYQ